MARKETMDISKNRTSVMNYVLDIVGGETGDKARDILADEVRKLKDVLVKTNKTIQENPNHPQLTELNKTIINLNNRITALEKFEKILVNFQTALDQQRQNDENIAKILKNYIDKQDQPKEQEKLLKKQTELIKTQTESSLKLTTAIFELIHQKEFKDINVTKRMKDGKPVRGQTSYDVETGKRKTTYPEGSNPQTLKLSEWIKLQISGNDIAENQEKTLSLLFDELKNTKTILVKNLARGDDEKKRTDSISLKLDSLINIIRTQQLGSLISGTGGARPMTMTEMLKTKGAKLPGLDASNLGELLPRLAENLKDIESKAEDKNISKKERDFNKGLKKTFHEIFSTDLVKVLRSGDFSEKTLNVLQNKELLKDSKRVTNKDNILPLLKRMGLNFQTHENTLSFKGQGREFHSVEQLFAQIQQSEGVIKHIVELITALRDANYTRKTSVNQGDESLESWEQANIPAFQKKFMKLLLGGVRDPANIDEIKNAINTGMVDALKEKHVYDLIAGGIARALSKITPVDSDRSVYEEKDFAFIHGERIPIGSLPPPNQPKQIKEIKAKPLPPVEAWGEEAVTQRNKKNEEAAKITEARNKKAAELWAERAEKRKANQEAEEKAKKEAESKAKKEAEKKRIAAEKAAKEIKKAEELAKTEISTAKQIDEEAKKTVEALTPPAGSGEPPKRKPRKKKEDLPVYGLAELEPIFKSILVNMEAIKKILMEQLNIQKKVADLISGKFIATVQQAINDEGGTPKVSKKVRDAQRLERERNFYISRGMDAKPGPRTLASAEEMKRLSQVERMKTSIGGQAWEVRQELIRKGQKEREKAKENEFLFKRGTTATPDNRSMSRDEWKNLSRVDRVQATLKRQKWEEKQKQIADAAKVKEIAEADAARARRYAKERAEREIAFPLFENDKNMRIGQIQAGMGSGFKPTPHAQIYPFDLANPDVAKQTGRGGEKIGFGKEWLGVPLKDLKEAGELLEKQKASFIALSEASNKADVAMPINTAMEQLNKNLDMVNSEMTIMESLMNKMEAIELDPKKFTPEELNKKQEELNELTTEYMDRLKKVEQIKQQSRTTTNQIADLQTKHIDKLNEKEKERASILAAQEALSGRHDAISKHGISIIKDLDPVLLQQAKSGISGIAPDMAANIEKYAISAKSDMEKNNEQLKFYKQSEVNLKNIIDLEKNLAELRSMQDMNVSGEEQVKQYKKIQDIVQNIELQRADSAKIIKNIEEDNQKQLRQTLKLTGQLFDYEKEIADYKTDAIGQDQAIKELRLQTKAFEELTNTMRTYGADSENIDGGRIKALQQYLDLTEEETKKRNIILAAHGKQVTSMEDLRNIQAKIIKFQEIQKTNGGKMTDESIRLYEEISKGVVHVENVSRKSIERSVSTQLEHQKKMKDGVDALTATWMKHLAGVTRTMKSSLNSLFGNILRIKIILGTIGYTLQREIKEGLIQIYRVTQQIVQTTEQISIMKTTLGDIFSPSANLNNEAFANTLVESVAKVTIGLGDMDGKIKRIPVSFAEAVTSIKGMAAIPGLKSFFFGRGTGDMSPDAIDAKVGNLLKAVQALQLIDPSQGVEGAMFSLREALSGDFISLKRRFEIQPHFLSQAIGKSVEELKNDPNLFLEGLSEYFESNFASVFDKMVQNPQGLIETIRSSIQYLMNAVGSGPKGLLKMVSERILMPVRDLFIGFLRSNEFKRITVLIQDKYASIFNSLQKLFDPSKFSGVLVDVFSTLFGAQMNTGGNQFSSLEKSIQVISEFIDEGIEKSIKYVIQNKGQILSLIENIKVMVGQIVKFIIPFGDKFMNTILPGMLKILEWVSSNSFLMMLSTLAMLLGVGNTISGIGGIIQFGGAALAQQAMAHAVSPGKGGVSQFFGKTLGMEGAGQYLLSGSHGANAINRLAGVDVSKIASEDVDVARYLSHRDDIKKGLIPAGGGAAGGGAAGGGAAGSGGTAVIGGTSLFGKMMPQGFGKMPFQQTGGLFSGPAGGWTAGAAGATLLAGIIPAAVAGVFAYIAQTGLEWITKDRKGVKDDSIYLMMQEGEYWKNIGEQFIETKGIVSSFFAAIRLGFQGVLGLVNEALFALYRMVTGWSKTKKAEDVFLDQMKEVFGFQRRQAGLTKSAFIGHNDRGQSIFTHRLQDEPLSQLGDVIKQQLSSAYSMAGGSKISSELVKLRQKDTILPADTEEINRLLTQRENVFNQILPSVTTEIKSYLPILEEQFTSSLRLDGVTKPDEVKNAIATFRRQVEGLLTTSITELTTDFADKLKKDPRYIKGTETGKIQANVSTLVARIEQSNIGFSEYVNTLMELQDQIRWMVPTKAQMLMRKDMRKQAEAMKALLEPTKEGSTQSKFNFMFTELTPESKTQVDKIATNVVGTILSTLGDDNKYKDAVSKMVELGTKQYDLSNEGDLIEILKIMNDDSFKTLLGLMFDKSGKLNVDALKDIKALEPLMKEIQGINKPELQSMLLKFSGAFKDNLTFDRTQLIKQYMELTGKDFKKVVHAQKKALVEMQLQSPNYSGVVQNIMDASKALETQEEVRKSFGSKEELHANLIQLEIQKRITAPFLPKNIVDEEQKKINKQIEKTQSEIEMYGQFETRGKELGSIYKQQRGLGVEQYIALLKKDIMEVNKAVKFSRAKTSASVLTSALKVKEMLLKAESDMATAHENTDIAGNQTVIATEKERIKTLTKLTPVLFEQYMTQMNRDFEKQVIGFKYLDTHKPEDIEKYMANLSQLLDVFDPEQIRLVAGKSLTDKDYENIGLMRNQLNKMLEDSQVILVEAYMGMMDKTINSLSNESKRQMTQLENMSAKIPKGSKWDQYKVDFGGRSIVPRHGSSGQFASTGYFAEGGLYGTNQETLREMARYSGMLKSESTTSMSIKARKMGTQQFVDKFSQMLPQAKETFERLFPEMIAASEKKMEELKIQMDKAGETHKNYEILKGQLRDVEAQHEEILASQKESFLAVEKATEEYNKMVDMLGDNSAFKAFHEGLMNMYRDFDNFEEQLALSFNNTGQILGRTMDDYFFNVFKGQIQDAKQVWSGFMRSIWDEFARTLSKMMSQNIIKGLFGGLMGEGSFGGGTGWLTNIFGSFGGEAKPTSGLDSIRAKIAQLPTSARANGGLITRPEVALLGEGRNNPEVVLNNTQLHQHLQSAVSRTIGEMKPRMSQSSGKVIQMTNNFRFEVTGSTNQETQDNMQKMMMALPEMINEQVRMTINEDDNVQESIRGIARQSYV